MMMVVVEHDDDLNDFLQVDSDEANSGYDGDHADDADDDERNSYDGDDGKDDKNDYDYYENEKDEEGGNHDDLNGENKGQADYDDYHN